MFAGKAAILDVPMFSCRALLMGHRWARGIAPDSVSRLFFCAQVPDDHEFQVG